MLDLYTLPTTANIGGRDFDIRTDFRAVLDIIRVQQDTELSPEEIAQVCLMIFYPDFDEIPPHLYYEAYMQMVDVMSCGIADDGKEHPRLVDWEKDASLIIAAINRTAGVDVRTVENLHWWTFFSYFMEIRESTFSDIVNIRSKLAKHKKLEKAELEFFRANRDAISLNGATEETREVKDEKQAILAFLDGKKDA